METPNLLGPLERVNLNLMVPTDYVSPFPHLKTETDTVSEMLCFLVIYNSGDEQRP
jgi:hypothetical protein